jgi:hypothetical protein
MIRPDESNRLRLQCEVLGYECDLVSENGTQYTSPGLARTTVVVYSLGSKRERGTRLTFAEFTQLIVKFIGVFRLL